MRFSRISIYLIALWVVSLATDSFQELLMIREPPEAGGKSRKVICLAEDDGAVLILNTDLRYNSSTHTDTKVISPRDITIDLWKLEEKDHWEFTDNFQDPMGPVFDYRWKDFDELSFGMTNKSRTYVGYIDKSIPIVFSVRGSEDIDILTCKRGQFSRSHCSGITIAARPKKTGLNKSSKVCQESKSYPQLLRPIISQYEWRTFILESTETQMKIQAHDSDCVFVTNKTYVDTEVNEQIFLNSSRSGRARFHLYDYLLTTEEDAKLYTLIFEHHGQNICIELMVSLCSACELDVSIVKDNNQDILIGKIFGKRNTTPSKLPTWQFEKLAATLPYNRETHIELKISTRMNGNVAIGRWAISRRIRECQPVVESQDAIQVSSSSILRTQIGSEYVFPTSGCQKLSYTENHIVRTDAQAASNISSNLQDCLRGRISRSCTYQQKFWKSGTSFCDRSGCICAPGFTGSDCKQECGDGSYGYDCRKSCDHCEDKACRKTTGWCTRDCAYNHLPPRCKTKLEAPAVSNVEGTTAVLRLNYSADLNVSEIRDLHFQLKTGTRDWTIPETKSQYSSMFEFTVCGLVSETRYTVRAVMQAQTRSGFWTYIESPEKDFNTTTSVQSTVTDSASCPTAACTKLPDTLCRPGQVPGNPLNVRVISQGKGVVTLKWNHPSSTCEQITRFQVEVRFVKTNLQKYESDMEPIFKNYTPSQHRPECTSNMNLDLLTSTLYNFSIKAINAHEPGELAIALFQIPASVGFIGTETPQVIRYETFIELKIPAVVNATRHSRVKVIVKGPPPCRYPEPSKSLKKLVDMRDSEKGWIARDFNVTESSPENVMIGNHPNDKSSVGACFLDRNETYVIVVVVVLEADQVEVLAILTPSTIISSIDERSPNSHLIWLVVLPILIICLLPIYVLHRKRKIIYARSKLLSVNYIDRRPTSPNGTSPDQPLDCRPYPMKLKKFEDYVKRAAENGVLESQFQMLRRGLVRPCDRGMLVENKAKNRYENLIAYDDTRVVLTGDLYGPHCDYINANYIEGYNKEHAYIATQSPMSNTVIDFWRMIWQEEVRIVCMLVNIIEDGQVMCEPYWPEVEQEVDHGHFKIRNVEQRVYAHYTHRTFELTSSREAGSRNVKHLHYTDWPEQGVPMYSHSIADYLNELRAMAPGPGPIVVHCTSGAGRTGTIILSDICLRYAAAEGTVDVFAEARRMYDARANMLDNLQQYVLAHLMPTQCLLFLSTKISCNNISPKRIKQLKKDLPVHMQRLEVSSWKDKALRPLEPIRPPLVEHLAKNRYPKFAPGGPSLVKLKRYPTHDTNSDYISAVSVDSLKIKRQFLASQLPLPETLSDFWRLVAEKQVELIVVLQRPSPEDPSCSEIIPSEETTIAPVPYITVKTKSTDDSNEYYTTDKLLLVDTSEPEARWQDITVLTCNNWSLAEDAEPPPPKALVALWSASENISRVRGCTLVLCHDGVTGCGLYLAMSLLLERMTVEHECDVILAVRAVRQSRSQFVNSKEQFLYLYDAAVRLVECFRTYANFS